MRATRGATRQRRNSGPWRTAPLEDADAISFVNRVQAADEQNLEPSIILAYAQFIAGCKFDGTWDKIKAACILMGARTISGALVPLVGTAPTNFNFVSADYDRKTGLVGNGSTKYLNSNIIENSYPLNSEHLSVYASSLQTAVNNGGYIGTPSSAILGFPLNTQTRYFSRQSSPVRNRAVSTAGLQGLSRSGSTSLSIYGSGSSLSVADASVGTGSSSVLIYRTTSTIYCNARLAFYSIGESIDLALLDARVTAMINAIQAAIP